MHAACLCGDVSWEVEGPFELMHHCHCGMCRKAHGTAFATVVAAPADRLQMRGLEGIVTWESSPGFWRRFCGRCGSSLPGNPVDGRVFVPCGNLEGDPGVPILAHIFVASKAPWYAAAAIAARSPSSTREIRSCVGTVIAAAVARRARPRTRRTSACA